ncbi:protein kinase, partial [Hamiltosporidium magnivora]
SKRFVVLSLLGTGTFGQVVKCRDSVRNEDVAIKIIKNDRAYYKHGISEVRLLSKLLERNVMEFFVEMKDAFIYKNHLCIVEEILGINLYQLLKYSNFKGFNHQNTKKMLVQILEGISILHSMGVTHCDLKPENILVLDMLDLRVKIIDFGSAFSEQQTTYFYVQSRYYRAPEVILGIPYNSSIDIWSFGCLAYELFTGHPLFSGKDNVDQIGKIVALLGYPPVFMLEHGKHVDKYFKNISNSTEICNKVNERKENEQILFKTTKKEFTLIKNVTHLTFSDVKNEIFLKSEGDEINTNFFIRFLLQCLTLNPLERPTAFEIRKDQYIQYDPSFETDESDRCVQPSPLPFDIDMRRNSINDVFTLLNTKKNKDTRKRSVYELPKKH